MQGLQQQQDAAKAQQAAQAPPHQSTDPKSQDPRLRPQQQPPGPPGTPPRAPQLDPRLAGQPQADLAGGVPAPPPGNPGDVDMKSELGGAGAAIPPPVKQETQVWLPHVLTRSLASTALTTDFCRRSCRESSLLHTGNCVPVGLSLPLLRLLSAVAKLLISLCADINTSCTKTPAASASS